MSSKSAHLSKKSHYTAYKAKDSAKVNKTRKLQKHLKLHPNDTQGTEALKNGVGRTRKTPINKNGWVTEEVKNYYTSLTYVFIDHVINYKDYTTAGSNNLKAISQIIKLSKKAETAPSVFKKGKVHPFYVNNKLTKEKHGYFI